MCNGLSYTPGQLEAHTAAAVVSGLACLPMMPMQAMAGVELSVMTGERRETSRCENV